LAGTISRALACCGWALLALAGCNNNPLPAELAATNTAVSAVIESSPRHLDPVVPPPIPRLHQPWSDLSIRMI